MFQFDQVRGWLPMHTDAVKPESGRFKGCGFRRAVWRVRNQEKPSTFRASSFGLLHSRVGFSGYLKRGRLNTVARSRERLTTSPKALCGCLSQEQGVGLAVGR